MARIELWYVSQTTVFTPRALASCMITSILWGKSSFSLWPTVITITGGSGLWIGSRITSSALGPGRHPRVISRRHWYASRSTV